MCECKAGTVWLLALYGSWKNLYFGSKCKKKKSGLQNALLWSIISRTHPFLWIDMHFYLKDRMNINVTRIKLKSVGRGDGNSRLFQGFRGHLVLSRVNLNTYFFYSLDIIGIFPLSTPNKIWPLGFKTYEKQDESTIYTNFRNTFTLFPSGCENIQTSVPRALWKRIWTRRRNPLLSLSSLDCLRAYMLSHFSSVWLFVTLWTAAHQASVSTGCSRQEYCCGLPGPPPGDLLTLVSPAPAGRLFTTSTAWEAPPWVNS